MWPMLASTDEARGPGTSRAIVRALAGDSTITSDRKNMKVMIVVMGVVLMITFVVGDALNRMVGSGAAGSRDPVVVTWSQGSVRESELRRLALGHRMAHDFLLQVILQCLERGGSPMVAGRQISQAQQIQSVGIPSESSEEALVQTMLLAAEADRLGIVVDNTAVNEFLKQISGPELAGADWLEIAENVLKNSGSGMSVGQLFDHLAYELQAQHVRVLAQTGLYAVPPGALWDYFNRLNRRMSIEAYPIDAEPFMAQVKAEPTEAELRKLFDEGRNRDPNPNLAEPGFHQPHQVAFAWLKVDFQPYLEEAKKQITDEQVEERYKQDIIQGLHKVAELPEEEPPADPTNDPTSEDAPVPATDPPATDAPADPAADRPAPDSPRDNALPPAETEPAPPADEPPAPTNEPPAPPAGTVPPEDGGAADCQQAELSDQARDETDPQDDPPPPTTPSQPDSAVDAPPADPVPATPATDAPATESPAAEPPATDPAAPSAEPPPAEPPTAEPKFKPLEEVREQIREQLAQPIAQEARDKAVKEAMDEINDYGRRYRRWQSLQESKIKTSATDPGKLDLATIAERYGFEHGQTPLVDSFQIAEHEIGQKVSTFDMEAARMGQFRMLSFADLAFGENEALYRAQRVESSDPDALYVYFRTDEKLPLDPSFEQARQQVKEAWKRQKAFELALAEAQKQADKAKGAASLGEVVSDPARVVTPPPFSWLTTGSLAFGFNEPQLSSVPGIDLAGQEFMRAVFSLHPGEVGVAPNQAHTKVYLVRVVSQQPEESMLRDQFLESGLNFQILSVAQREVMQVLLDWYRGLEEQYRVKWQRPPYASRMQM
jgi:hypothetical protein